MDTPLQTTHISAVRHLHAMVPEPGRYATVCPKLCTSLQETL